MWRDIRTMCRYSPCPLILVPIEMAILLSALTVLPCVAAEEYSRWRSGSPKPRRSPFWKFARWLPVPIVSVPICFGITVFIMPCASHSCCFGSEETPYEAERAIVITGRHTTGRVEQPSTSVVVAKSYTVTWTPSDGRQQSTLVITTDGNDLTVRGAGGSTLNVIGPKNNTHSYLVLEGALDLKASWKSSRNSRQEVAIVVYADGKVNVAPESVQQCGASGEKLDFDGCRIKLGDIPLQIALGKGFWKLSGTQVVTPTPETAQQSPSQRAAHIPPPNQLRHPLPLLLLILWRF